MRIASAYAFESSLGNLQRRQQALSEAQMQLTSGKRVQRASDDPTAAAQAARATYATTRLTAQQRALDASKADMQLSESALGDAGTLLQQARDLVVSAGNGSYTQSDRDTIVKQLIGLRNDLRAVANRQDANGRFLFAGQGLDPTLAATPFAASDVYTPDPAVAAGPYTTDAVTYAGASGGQQAATDQVMPLTIDGDQAWMQTDDPSNPGTPISVFDALDKTIQSLSDPTQSVSTAVSQGLGRIDAVAGSLSSWRSYAGSALNTADTIDGQLSQAKLDAETQRSNAEDLDMVQAISDFQNKQTGYDAALKTYSLVQKMSLFDYLK
jgi:flagellar hook-associated protein 3 FlgL